MEKSVNKLNIRWFYLVVGTVSMLFAGIIYAWSILKMPLAAEFGWGAGQLALNFTLTMCFFCVGCFLGSLISKWMGVKLTVMFFGAFAGLGFVFTAFVNGNLTALFLAYAVAAGLGIGISYNVIIATVSAWFPDKRGLASGCLLMGFGLSTLIFGKLFDSLFAPDSIGWRMAFILFGVAIAIVLALAGLILKKPGEDVIFPKIEKTAAIGKEAFEPREFNVAEMLKRRSFWFAFLCISFLAAVGNSVISFAKDLAVSVGAAEKLATTLVGILAVCNGLGRIITGACFDRFGRKITMLAACVLTLAAPITILCAVKIESLGLCILGLCLTGISYGTSPTLCSAFTSAFYGQKHFATNYSVMTFTLMVASFAATACSGLLVRSGAYVAPFLLLIGLAVVAFFLNLSIKRP